MRQLILGLMLMVVVAIPIEAKEALDEAAYVPMVVKDAPFTATKKGIALACGRGEWGEVNEATGATWAYGFSVSIAERQAIGAGYVPHHAYGYSDYTEIVEFVERYPGSYVLIGNEPNDPNQDNMTAPEAAIAQSGVCRAVMEADAQAKCIIGGVLNDASFMGDFLSYWPDDVEYAGTHFHYYTWGTGATDLLALKQTVAAFMAMGEGEKWLTEWGVIGYGTEALPDGEVVDFIEGAVDYLENKDGVTRYSFFSWELCDWQYFPARLLSESIYANAYK